VVGLGQHIGIESGTERDTVGVHAPWTLLLREPIIRTVDSGCHGYGPINTIDIGKHGLRLHIGRLILLLWEHGVVLGSKTWDVEGPARSSGVGHGCGCRSDTACAETGQEGSTGVGSGCGSHCWIELR